MREIRKPHLYDSNPVRRGRKVKALLNSPEERLQHFQMALVGVYIGNVSTGDALNRALAELVFGFGASAFAKRLGVSSTSIYRTISFTERRDLRVDKVDQILREFGLRLDVVMLSPAETKLEARRRQPRR